MSGEIPTPETALQRVIATISHTSAILLREVEYASVEMDDQMMSEVFAEIHRLFALRGRSSELTAAVEATEAEDKEQREVREQLLQKYGFGSDTEAAEHIAAYWQGDKPDNLLASIMGYGDIEISNAAHSFASRATRDDPEASRTFSNASNLLWRDTRAGLGGQIAG